MKVTRINKVNLIDSLEPAAATNCALEFRGRRAYESLVVRRPRDEEVVGSNRCPMSQLRKETIDDLFHLLQEGPLAITDTRNVVRYIMSFIPKEEPIVYVPSFYKEYSDTTVVNISDMNAPPRAESQNKIPNALSVSAHDYKDAQIASLRILLSTVVEDFHWANYDLNFTFGTAMVDAYLTMPALEQDGWMMTCSQIHYPCSYRFSEAKLVLFTFGSYVFACPEGFTKQTLRDAIVRSFNVMTDLLSMQKQGAV